MNYVNPAPIAAGTYYRKEVVDACIKVIQSGLFAPASESEDVVNR